MQYNKIRDDVSIYTCTYISISKSLNYTLLLDDAN